MLTTAVSIDMRIKMAVISFGELPDQIWLAARWAHNRFLEDVVRVHSEDKELVDALQQAMALDGLHFSLEKHELTQRLFAAIEEIALVTVSDIDLPGMEWKLGLSEESKQLYLQGLRHLLDILESGRSTY